MKILFWNTYKNAGINEYLSSLIKDNDIDIVVLAEYVADIQELYMMVRENQKMIKLYPSIGCERVKFLGTYINVEQSVQDYYYSIQIVNKSFIICGVHMPSDLHRDHSKERYKIARQIMSDIHKEEKRIGKMNTIIVGDFNEMPYAEGCLNADSFHGLPIFDEDTNCSRTVARESYLKYYNPMWNFFGDFTKPPGTYYRNDSSMQSPMWFILDQFIFGSDVIPLIKREQLKIITFCSKGSLFNSKGHPNKKISDHFPIMCEIVD